MWFAGRMCEDENRCDVDDQAGCSESSFILSCSIKFNQTRFWWVSRSNENRLTLNFPAPQPIFAKHTKKKKQTAKRSLKVSAHTTQFLHVNIFQTPNETKKQLIYLYLHMC